MDLHHFNFQDMEGRAAFIWEHGTFMDFREEGEYLIMLYDMDNFFAKAWYNPGKIDIQLVIGFKSLICLEPYLEGINIK